MNNISSELARKLVILRKEKNLSQKNAAESLGVQQALLSHYENGKREPGLSFLAAAADFYEVSTDFLLGRSTTKDGRIINLSPLKDDFTDDPDKPRNLSDNRLGMYSTAVSKRLLIQSMEVLYALCAYTKDSYFIKQITSLLYLSIYRCFRFVFKYNRDNYPEMLSIDEEKAFRFSAAMENITESKINTEIETHKPDISLPRITTDFLEENYGGYGIALMTVIHNTEKALQKFDD